jgi:hypothetical protein
MRKTQQLLCGLLTALLTFAVVPSVHAQEALPVRVGGIDEGGIYFEPVLPEITVSEGYNVREKTLDGQPYDGSVIAEQGLYALSVLATDQQGKEFLATTRFSVLDASQRAPTYTTDLVRYLVERLAKHPHVTPTSSADQRLIVGRSRGWPKDPEVPEHDLYAFQITDHQAQGPKIRVVLVGGNHPREQTGSWALHGALDFLVSDDPRAGELRQWIAFFVYPMVNPDGRYALSGRSSPEMQAEKVTDHNRVWNTSDRFTTTDIIARAIKADTGGTAQYLLDFHSAGSTFFYTGAKLMTSPYAQTMTAREPKIKPTRSEGHPGMIRNWAMSDEGLAIPFAYTPELAGTENARRSMEIGRSFMLAFHDLLSGRSVLAAAEKILEHDDSSPFGSMHRQQIPALKGNLEKLLATGDATVERILEEVYALYGEINDYRQSIELAAEAKRLADSARQLVDSSPLTLAAWLPEVLLVEGSDLTNRLADPAAELLPLQAQNKKLVDLMDAMRRAQSAEEAVSAASEVLEESVDGFGQLYQNDVRSNRDRLVELLQTPGTGGEQYRLATEILDASIASYWQIRPLEPFPAVSPVSVTSSAQTIAIVDQADWEDGFLVHVQADDDGLVLAHQPMLRFDGDGDYVETGFVPGESTLGQQFTWEFWKRYRFFADATGSSGNRGTPPRFYTQLSGTDGEFRAAIGDSYWTATKLEKQDHWYHLAVVFDQGEVRTYVDGQLRDTRTDVTFSGDSSSPLAIGRGFGEGRWLDGSSRDHRIWNVARSPAELRRNRHRQFDGSEPGLVGYWRLDEGQGDTVHDRSASANHATVTGAVWKTQPISGFRISQPLAFEESVSASDIIVSWEVVAEAGADRVAVSFGLSEEDATLPGAWHPVSNGDSLAESKEKTNFAGRHLWLKQTLSQSESESPVALRRLTVEVK